MNKLFEMADNIVHVRISPEGASLDGKMLIFEGCGSALLNAIYRSRIGDYPKYFKMDPLSKLGFVAAELLLQKEVEITGTQRKKDCDDRAVIFFNNMGSYADDKLYWQTIADPDNFYPSPGIFVYTLPNIVTGEIAIRNRYYGETCFYCLPSKDMDTMENVVAETLGQNGTSSVIWGWLDCTDSEHFDAELFLSIKRGQ